LNIAIDTNIFLSIAFEEPGWEYCGRLLNSVFIGEQNAMISAIQLSELYTPFERTGDESAKEKMANEIKKSRIKIVAVDEEIASLSARIRATEKTPAGDWLALADSIILGTALREKATILYSLDLDFSIVKGQVKITAPGMSLEEWNEKFGVQRKLKVKSSAKKVVSTKAKTLSDLDGTGKLTRDKAIRLLDKMREEE
jgi:predicted nucleic acid-binding protein